jgi:hypothetical protein
VGHRDGREGRYAPTVAARSPQTQTLEGGVHQRPLEPFATPDVPPLVGDLGLCGGGLADGCIEVVFGALGSDYVLKYQYPTGFDARPDDLWTFENLVNVFQIENRATVTPTPTLDATLGDAGYWTAEEAARMALDMIPYGPWSVTDTRLVSEAEAAGLNLCDMHRDDPDYQWYAYPTGVWIVELTGVFDGRNAVFYTYLDAKTGTHICTAEKGTRP